MLWIILSDQVVVMLFGGNDQLLTLAQTTKGTFFVLASSLIIYLLTYGFQRDNQRQFMDYTESLQAYIEQVRQKNSELEQTHEGLIKAWAHALELRDLETAGHSQRVTAMMVALAPRFGFKVDRLRWLRYGSLLHDIGKIGIPDAILLKPGPLTDEEYAIIKRHPELTLQFLGGTPYLWDALAIPLHHHERWDGAGYPDGLAGQNIPLEARLFAVIDACDAMGSNRPYRKAMRVESIYAELKRFSGTQFDPAVVEAVIEMDLLCQQAVVGDHFLR